MDPDLKALRNDRWAKAFSESATEESAKESIDRKATIVIEHLIQASDVAHTMQVREAMFKSYFFLFLRTTGLLTLAFLF